MLTLVGLGLSGLRDVGMNLLVVHILGKIFGPVPVWIYGVGVLFAPLPDFDALFQKFRGQEIDSKHRDIAHQPILLVIPAFIIISLFSKFWALLVSLCFLAHYFNDSITVGWGIKWLAPFSSNQYQFFTRNAQWRIVLVRVWTPNELARIQPMPMKEWLQTYYLKPTLESVSGALTLLAAVLIIFLWR